MQPTTGEIFNVTDEAEARRRGLVPIRRDLTERERMDRQILLYQPCGCGSGEKFKFCCHRKSHS